MRNRYGKIICSSAVIFLFISGLCLPIAQSQVCRQYEKPWCDSPPEDAVPHATGLYHDGGSDNYFHSMGRDNHPPHPPLLTGPTSGRIGIEYTWTIMSTDPDNDTVTYYVDWGDQCGAPDLYGPSSSGEDIEISHTYHFKSTFIINARAIDVYGAESNTTYFQVIMPKTALLASQLFPLFLGRFPSTIIVFR